VRTDDLAEEAFVNGAEDFNRDVVEEVGRFLVADFIKEAGQPFVADDEFFAEVVLEEVAVEERDVRGRAAVERSEVADEGMPERSALTPALSHPKGEGARRAGEGILVHFERLLAGAARGVRGGVLASVADEAFEGASGVNVAVLADAEEEDAIEVVTALLPTMTRKATVTSPFAGTFATPRAVRFLAMASWIMVSTTCRLSA